MNAPKITYVGGIMIRARDVGVMAQWYSHVLGLSFDMEEDTGRYAIITTPLGPLHFAIRPRPAYMPRGGPTTAVTLRVADFEATLEFLADEQIPVREAAENEHGRFVYLRDPEENELCLWGS